MPPVSRRRYLETASVLGATALAGCGGQVLERGDSEEEAELRERVETLETQNDNLRAKLDRQNETVETSTTERERLETRLAEERNETRQLRQQLENRTGEVEALRARIESQEERITQLQETISVLQADSDESRFDEATRDAALELGEQVRESVVFLEMRHEGRRSQGTGFFIGHDRIVTNSHVVGQATDITCWTLGGDTLGVEVVGRVESADPDVALLAVTDGEGDPLETGDSRTLSADQPLVQVGHPGSFGNWVISLGTFVRRETYRSADGGTHTELKTLVPTIPGNSGSPLLTLDGDVVGLTYAGVPQTYRPPDEAPQPAPSAVYEAVAPQTYTLHETIERVQRQLGEWE
ncbi:S1 family peptidase [Halorussus amylolyticus]|uniref:S1 family peptidase n=1 Tax=Halorussus amylolyticus TaxID=1126242 RepID=UPI0010439A99|nr:serine protease [Halorussus amylolyticus]